jgi:hypothetical protein
VPPHLISGAARILAGDPNLEASLIGNGGPAILSYKDKGSFDQHLQEWFATPEGAIFAPSHPAAVVGKYRRGAQDDQGWQAAPAGLRLGDCLPKSRDKL